MLSVSVKIKAFIKFGVQRTFYKINLNFKSVSAVNAPFNQKLRTIIDTKHYVCNDGQRVSVGVSTATQRPIDSLWSSRFLCGDVILTQASDDSASNVKVWLI